MGRTSVTRVRLPAALAHPQEDRTTPAEHQHPAERADAYGACKPAHQLGTRAAAADAPRDTPYHAAAGTAAAAAAPWPRAAPQELAQAKLTRRLTTIESCSMFMLEDMENFFRLSSLAASIAALLWGGDGSLLAPRARTACHAVSSRSPKAHPDSARRARRRRAAAVWGAGAANAHGWGSRGRDSLCQLLSLLDGERPSGVAHFPDWLPFRQRFCHELKVRDRIADGHPTAFR